MLRSDRGISRDVGESTLAGFGFARMRSGESESVVDCDVIEESLAVGEARWLRHGASGSERGLQARVVSDLVVLRLGERGLRAQVVSDLVVLRLERGGCEPKCGFGFAGAETRREGAASPSGFRILWC